MSTNFTTARRSILAALGAATLTFGLAACHGSSGGGGDTSSSSGSGGSTGGSSGSAAGGGTTVEVKDFAFNPKTINVKTGGKVTWKFEDSTAHNVDLQSLNEKSMNLKSGGSYSATFSKPGTYSYLCTIHPFMTGKVVVK